MEARGDTDVQIVRCAWRRGRKRIEQSAAFFTFSNIFIGDVAKQHETMVGGQRVSLVNLWGQVITLRGQILVSRTGDDTLRFCVVCCALCVVGVQFVGVGVFVCWCWS